MRPTWESVPRVGSLSRQDFYSAFVEPGRPVVMSGLTQRWRAHDWGPEYFRTSASTVRLPVKRGDVSEGRRVITGLADYAEELERHERDRASGRVTEGPGYLHDVPLFLAHAPFRRDVDPFPLFLLPSWYRENWWQYAQYFMGPAGSETPLHFDTLLTNNLFFHLAGRKQFTLLPASQRELCYPRGWRWAEFDPTSPDYDRFPRAAGTTPVTVVLEPGDVLYLPPGTLHHVRNLSLSSSFNIDWHTADSAARGVLSVLRGAPVRNGYYNLVSLIGLGLGVPSRYLYPFYKSYLTYVS
ncbi:cupin-like domain-containing protein [Streptomyces sp. NPDC057638]|uniref:cupin-like domain-containing protein n=1 Tax=Streptomyces sp. NPDC057638 TaxID=3346190 RepID=UPI0036B556E1